MSNNIVTLEGIITITEGKNLDGTPVAIGKAQTIANDEPHPIIMAGAALEIANDTAELMGANRFWARVQGKLVSFHDRSYVFAKSIIPSIRIPADDAEVFIRNVAYQEISVITLDGYLHPPREIGTYDFANVSWPLIKTIISTDKRYSGGDHPLVIIGEGVRIYHQWMVNHTDGFHAFVQGKLETKQGMISVKALYLRPSNRMDTGSLVIP